MSAPARAGRTARPPLDLNRVGFDVFLLVIVGALVISALSLRPAAALMPLIVGVPTVAALLARLVADVLRIGKDFRPAVAEPEHEPTAEELAHASLSEIAQAAQAEIDEDSRVTAEEGRRQRVFALWGLAFVAVSSVLTLTVAAPPGLRTWFLPAALVAMVVILRVIRVGWVRAIAISAVLVAVMYLLLVLFLQVRL